MFVKRCEVKRDVADKRDADAQYYYKNKHYKRNANAAYGYGGYMDINVTRTKLNVTQTIINVKLVIQQVNVKRINGYYKRDTDESKRDADAL